MKKNLKYTQVTFQIGPNSVRGRHSIGQAAPYRDRLTTSSRYLTDSGDRFDAD